MNFRCLQLGEAMRIRYAAKTDVGMKRTHNEDYFSLMEDEQLFIVADGMGGHSSGEVASRMAAETVSEFYQRTKDEEATWPYKMDRSLSYIENRLACGIKLANYKIYEAASKDIRFKGMGTTLVTCLINGDKIYIAHVGDSRCYRVREGKIDQMTRDHSLLEDYKDAKPDMTEEEERNFPHKNVITRALGMRDSVQVDITTQQVKDGDVYLLCSDGLSGMVEDPALERILVEAPDLEHSVAELVDQANRAGGTDNITTLILQCTNVAAGDEAKEEAAAKAEDKKASDESDKDKSEDKSEDKAGADEKAKDEKAASEA
jgi:serine/threonine protein phosphatase PrpC